MYHRVRRKFQQQIICSAALLIQCLVLIESKDIPTTDRNIFKEENSDFYDNDISDFDDEIDIQLDQKYESFPTWNGKDKSFKESHKYMIINDKVDLNKFRKSHNKNDANTGDEYGNGNNREFTTTDLIDTTLDEYIGVIPLELISTTENILSSIMDSTDDPDLTVIPLSTTPRTVPNIIIPETITLPTSTEIIDNSATTEINTDTTESTIYTTNEYTTKPDDLILTRYNLMYSYNKTKNEENNLKIENTTKIANVSSDKINLNKSSSGTHDMKLPSRGKKEKLKQKDHLDEKNDDPLTDLDNDKSSEVPEDYYDTKDLIPTKAPITDALSVIFGLAGSVVESVAERVVPKGIFDLFKRMQKQSEAIEAEKLRSKEENGGLGQFGRGILKTISSGLSKPFTQLMAGARDIGSLDNDRSFVTSLASGVTSVANVATSLGDTFKDRVQAIYPGTLWCGDGHSATARSSDLGLFFFTDTCCRQHDACRLYIRAGDTKYGLTNTGLFTRSHCSCDLEFRDCLRKTNTLISAQIGLTYFNVLGPQCFRKAHPIMRCLKRTRITGQKCEEYELDHRKPKIWQWFDNETF